MSATQKRKTYCVWDNHDDTIVAIDETADVCAALMGIGRKTFYVFCCSPERGTRWTIIKSTDIESEDEEE